MKYNPKNLGIIIAAISVSKNLIITLNSIKNSNIQTGEVNIVFPYKVNFKKIKKKYSNFKFYRSKISNQVYQRNLGVNKFSKKVKIILKLYDKVKLKKNCLKELLNDWNNKKKIIGIGISPIGQKRPNPNIFQILSCTNSYKDGVVLKSGYGIGWKENNKEFKTQWLNGGMTSWKLERVKNRIKKRKFPNIKWCVAEDLIFSYKYHAQGNLILSKNAKAKLLKSNKIISVRSKFYEGYIHSKITNSFVRMYPDLSFFIYIYATISSSIFGIIASITKLNFFEIPRFYGRFIGAFSYYNKKFFN